MLDMKYIGSRCMEFRKNKTVYSQSDVGRDVCCGQYNVSKFERGQNNNALILLWYFLHGMAMSDLFPKGGKE